MGWEWRCFLRHSVALEAAALDLLIDVPAAPEERIDEYAVAVGSIGCKRRGVEGAPVESAPVEGGVPTGGAFDPSRSDADATLELKWVCERHASGAQLLRKERLPLGLARTWALALEEAAPSRKCSALAADVGAEALAAALHAVVGPGAAAPATRVRVHKRRWSSAMGEVAVLRVEWLVGGDGGGGGCAGCGSAGGGGGNAAWLSFSVEGAQGPVCSDGPMVLAALRKRGLLTVGDAAVVESYAGWLHHLQQQLPREGGSAT